MYREGVHHLAATLSRPSPNRHDSPGESRKKEPNTRNCCVVLPLFVEVPLYPTLPLPLALSVALSTPGEGRL